MHGEPTKGFNKVKRLLLLTFLAAFLAASSSAAIITFEGVVPEGGSENVNPTEPYTEGLFTLTPSDEASAIFSATSGVNLPGNSTDFFGFGPTNTITLSGVVPFDLVSMFIGPTDIGSGTISFTVIGQIFGGGTTSITFTDLTTGGVQLIGFTNLESATFSTPSDAGIDDITLSTAADSPEPTSVILFATGLLALCGLRRRQTRKC